MTHTIALVVIHKGVEIVIIRVGSPISRPGVWLVKRIDRAVIDHMAWVIAPPADSEIAYLVSVSPSTTEITLGLQTMMGSVTQGHLLTGGAVIHGAKEPMVTEICTNIALGGGGAGTRGLYEDPGGGRHNPLAFGNLNADRVIVYWSGSR